MLNLMYWTSLGIFLLFALGVWVRLTAILTWVAVVSFLASPAANYDADYLVALLAFYLGIGYLLLGQWGRSNSMAERILGPRDVGLLAWFLDNKSDRANVPSYGANLAMRLWQVHFAIVVVVSGLHKLQFGDWWAGVAFWYPLHSPFATTPETIQAEIQAGSVDFNLFMMSLAQYLALAWQIGFPLFAWKKGWRVVLVGGAALGWLGSFFIFKLPLYGPVYFLGCLSYLTPEEWLGLERYWRSRTNGGRAAPEKKPKFLPRIKGA